VTTAGQGRCGGAYGRDRVVGWGGGSDPGRETPTTMAAWCTSLSCDPAPTVEGRAFVYWGRPQGLSPTPAWIAESNQTFAYFGREVRTAGDVNGDGFDEVIVGADGYAHRKDDEGAAFLYGRRTGL
jgi:hypothetical protein